MKAEGDHSIHPFVNSYQSIITSRLKINLKTCISAQHFSDADMRTCLTEIENPMVWVWGEAGVSVFLRSSRVVLMLLALGPHGE